MMMIEDNSCNCDDFYHQRKSCKVYCTVLGKEPSDESTGWREETKEAYLAEYAEKFHDALGDIKKEKKFLKEWGGKFATESWYIMAKNEINKYKNLPTYFVGLEDEDLPSEDETRILRRDGTYAIFVKDVYAKSQGEALQKYIKNRIPVRANLSEKNLERAKREWDAIKRDDSDKEFTLKDIEKFDDYWQFVGGMTDNYDELLKKIPIDLENESDVARVAKDNVFYDRENIRIERDAGRALRNAKQRFKNFAITWDMDDFIGRKVLKKMLKS